MKFARFIAVVLGLLASAVMLFSIGLCLVSLDAKPLILEKPHGAVECAEALQEAVLAGDYDALSQVIYGQPDLGADRDPGQRTGVMIWEAFQNSISFEYQGDFYATDSGIARNAVVTAMDIPSVTAALSGHAHALLTARVENAVDMAELYDENNEFREELVQTVLEEAVVRALAEDAETVTLEVKVELVCPDGKGKWWAVPDQALLRLLSGGVA